MSTASDRELLELIAAQVSKLTNEFTEFKKETNEHFSSLDNHLIRIENDHGKKLDALLDGYKQLAEDQNEMKSQISTLIDSQEEQDLDIRVLKGKAK